MATVRGKTIKGLTYPATGAFWGADDNAGFTSAGGIETAAVLGRTMAIRNRHHFWGAAFPGGHATDAANSKIIPMVTWGSQGSSFPTKGNGSPSTNTATVAGHQGMDRILAGEFDSTQLRPTLTALNGLNVPVLFRPWQEMNIPAMNCYGGYQGGTGGAGQTTFMNAWRYLHSLCQSMFPANQILFVWCPTQFDPDNNKLTYYPGDAFVDIIGLDLYRHSFLGNVDDAYDFAVTHSKPFIIAEAGFQENVLVNGVAGDGSSPFSKSGNAVGGKATTSLITNTRNMIKGVNTASAKYVSNTIAYVTWNYNAGTGLNNLVNSSTTSLNLYRQWVTDPYFNIFKTSGGGGGTSGPPLGGLPTLSDTTPVVNETITCDPGQWTDPSGSGVTFGFQWQVSVDGITWSNAASSGDPGGPPPPPPPPPGTLPSTSVTTTNIEFAGVPTGGTPQSEEDTFALRKAILRNGHVYAGGFFTKVGSTGHASQYVLNSPTTRNHLAAYNASTGALDAWNPNCDADVYMIIPGPTGKVFVSGLFTTINGSSRSKVALISDDTTLASPTVDATFNPGTINGRVSGLAYDSGTGMLYISGTFTSVGGTTRNGLACLSATTGALQNWNPGLSGSTHDGRRVVLGKHSADQSDIYVAGEYSSINGVSRLGLAAVDKTSSTSSPTVRSWNPDLGGSTSTTKPHDLTIKPDGTKLVVATAGSDASGDGNQGICYTLVSGGVLGRQNARNWAVKAQSDGGDHNACGSDDNYVFLGHHGDGVSGTSTTNNGFGNKKVYGVKWDGTTSTWIPTTQPNSVQGTYTIEIYDDRILVGGCFSTPRQGLLQYTR